MKKSIILLAVLTVLGISFYGCSSLNNKNSSKLDLAEYFEKDSGINNMLRIYESSQYPEPTITPYTDTVEVKDNLITHEAFGRSSLIVQINENDLNITNTVKNTNYSLKRYVTIGEEVSSHSIDAPVVQNGINLHIKQTETCVMNAKKESITLEIKDENLTYKGDIISQICTAIGTQTYLDLNVSVNYTDKYHEFYTKDKGRIVAVNENCLIPQKSSNQESQGIFYDIDDNSKECIKTNSTFNVLVE